MPSNAPPPGKFDEDPRVHFDKTVGKWQYEDDETGQEFEWSDAAKAWVPLVSQARPSMRMMEADAVIVID